MRNPAHDGYIKHALQNNGHGNSSSVLRPRLQQATIVETKANVVHAREHKGLLMLGMHPSVKFLERMHRNKP